jgi:hypothetical protein
LKEIKKQEKKKNDMDVKYQFAPLKVKEKNFLQSMQTSFNRPSPAEKARLKGKVYHVMIDKNNKGIENKKMKGPRQVTV